MIIKLYEKFTDVEETKNIIFLKAVETHNVDIVDFFVKKGYDINADNAAYKASWYDDMFRYFLKHKANIDFLKFDDRRLMDFDVQKALIDFGLESFIYENGKFNNKLRDIPEYAKVIARFEEIGKYNL